MSHRSFSGKYGNNGKWDAPVDVGMRTWTLECAGGHWTSIAGQKHHGWLILLNGGVAELQIPNIGS